MPFFAPGGGQTSGVIVFNIAQSIQSLTTLALTYDAIDVNVNSGLSGTIPIDENIIIPSSIDFAYIDARIDIICNDLVGVQQTAYFNVIGSSYDISGSCYLNTDVDGDNPSYSTVLTGYVEGGSIISLLSTMSNNELTWTLSGKLAIQTLR